MKTICVVTGSRADYGLLSRLMTGIRDDAELSLQIIATNMHLSSEFGLTYREIEADGFRIDKKIETLLSSDTAESISKSVGLALIGFADAFEDLQPDLLLVLGDRSEILAAVTAALFKKIPVAHLHGGEITVGAYDDAMRHAITKMSHLHFTSTEEYRNRVIQLGEQPDRVFNVGAIGVDNIRHTRLIAKDALQEDLGFEFGSRSVIVTFHPVTLEDKTAEQQTRGLLRALEAIPDLRILFSLPNSDEDGRIIGRLINGFVDTHRDRAKAFHSLGRVKYLSALACVDAVVGNSSSGMIEAPSFHVPTLNIGNRQAGRARANSVVDCDATFEAIHENLIRVLSPEFKDHCKVCTNPFEKENTALNILSIIREIPLDNLILKKFHNI